MPISPNRFNPAHRLKMSQAQKTGILDQIEGDYKLCPRCEQSLPLTDFNKSSKRTNGYQLWCRSCSREHKRWRYRNGSGDKIKLQARKYQLKTNYGLTLEEYQAMLDKQGGGCAICGRQETQRSNPQGVVDSLRVDHCHTTGKIRGLLCSKCNFGLSNFNDNPELLINAAKYLRTIKN